MMPHRVMVPSLLVALALLFASAAAAQRAPEVAFTQVAQCGAGEDSRGSLSGVVSNVATPQTYRIVLYAFAGDRWWVQPLANAPRTQIQPNGAWSSWTHLGYQYAALLVRSDYNPPSTTQSLPEVDGAIVLAFAATPCEDR